MRSVVNEKRISLTRVRRCIYFDETFFLHLGEAEPKFPDDGKLQLFSMRFCPYAQRIHIVLEAKKIPYHTFNIDLSNKPEWLTKYSPLGKVPALLLPETGQPFLYESLVIADYLDEKYPERPLHPKDPLAKALDKLFVERFANITNAFYKLIIKREVEAKAELTIGFDGLEAELNKRGTPFFGGKEPGMADYMIWPWIERIDMFKYIKGLEYEFDQKAHAALVRIYYTVFRQLAVFII